MKTKLFTLAMLLTLSMAGNAKIKSSIHSVNVTFTPDFDGNNLLGTKYSSYNPKGFGFEGGFTFDCNQEMDNNMTVKLGATYTLMLINKHSHSIFFSVGVGPAYITRSEKDDSKKYSTTEIKHSIGAYMNPQISYSKSCWIISVGAYGDAPKFKFKKDDGAYLGLSVSVGYVF